MILIMNLLRYYDLSDCMFKSSPFEIAVVQRMETYGTTWVQHHKASVLKLEEV